MNKKNVRFKAVRASGPGGQRASRRSTKVQLWVKIDDLPLSDEQKRRLKIKIPPSHLNERGEIWVESQEERSRELNRNKALQQINNLIENALKVLPPRLSTEPSRKAENERIREKKIISVKKKGRREF